MAAWIESAGSVEGQEVVRVVLESARGLRAGILSYGATLQFLTAPAAGGGQTHLVLGFDTPDAYRQRAGHLGATVGRFANRIAEGRFTLDGRTYQLARNENGRTHLHGGPRGFAKRIWHCDPGRLDEDGTSAVFELHSADGDEGYPGNLAATCTYSLAEPDRLIIEMTATTDAPTPVNLVNHTYWNLAGTATIDGHELEVEADRTLEAIDDVPTGRAAEVAGTIYDFRRQRPVGNGYDPAIDRCFVVRGSGMRRFARLAHPASGRTLELFADQPALHVYTGFKLHTQGRDGIYYGPGSGLCLETEAYPDAPNHADFPSCILRPGQTYRHRMDHVLTLPR